MSSADCLNAFSHDCFTILDTSRTKHELSIEENLFITWLKPTFNKQTSHPMHHFFVHLTFPLLAPSPFLTFCFLFSNSISEILVF